MKNVPRQVRTMRPQIYLRNVHLLCLTSPLWNDCQSWTGLRGQRRNVCVYTWWVALLVVSAEWVSQQYNHMDVCVVYKYIVKSAWKLYCLKQISYRVVCQPITFSQNITTEKRGNSKRDMDFIFYCLYVKISITKNTYREQILLHGIICTCFP